MDINQVRKLNANLSKNYTTNMTMIIKVLLASKGSVVECGGGVFSTPLLHWMCKMMDRELISYENDEEYYAFEHTFQSRQHKIRFVEDWDKIDTKTHRSVVLIDHHPPKRRSIETIRFKNTADYIIIHDTERDNDEYDNGRIWKHFKYRYDWKDCRPWTSVVSNFKDLSFLNK